MDENKKSFKLYFDQYEPTRNLSDEYKARLWDAVFQFNMGEEVHFDDPLLEALFVFFRQQFQRNDERYAEKCRKNSENGSKGGRPRKTEENQSKPNESEGNPKKANGFSENPTKAKKADNDNDNDIKSPPIPPQGGTEAKATGSKRGSIGDYSEDFLAFWEKYPRKVNKGQAWKAYAKKRDAGRLPEDLLERLGNKCLCDQWRKDNGEFIPHPATWLNAEGWEDSDCVIESFSDGWEDELDALYEIGKRCEIGLFDTPEEVARKEEIYKNEYEPMLDDMHRRGCRAI